MALLFKAAPMKRVLSSKFPSTAKFTTATLASTIAPVLTALAPIDTLFAVHHLGFPGFMMCRHPGYFKAEYVKHMDAIKGMKGYKSLNKKYPSLSELPEEDIKKFQMQPLSHPIMGKCDFDFVDGAFEVLFQFRVGKTVKVFVYHSDIVVMGDDARLAVCAMPRNLAYNYEDVIGVMDSRSLKITFPLSNVEASQTRNLFQVQVIRSDDI